jgi:hypothetical protein
MEYTYKQIENGDWQLLVIVNEIPIVFILSEDLIGTEDTPPRGLPEHIQMIQDFKDVSKLEYFIQLLIDNPGTAFSIYNNFE